MIERVTAVFDVKHDAEEAINELRSQGMTDEQLSIVARHQEDEMQAVGSKARDNEEVKDEAGDTAKRAGTGLLAGAGVGAVFGLGAALIPGVGPFITAGWLATVLGATAGGMASGAIVGGTAGAIAGALAKAGYDEEEAHFYGDAIERGDTLVTVDTRNTALSTEAVKATLINHNGRMANDDSGAASI